LQDTNHIAAGTLEILENSVSYSIYSHHFIWQLSVATSCQPILT
jgi:hypothetical protein